MRPVDLAFPLVAAEVPRDHGYVLYGALCRAVPQLHAARWLGVHPLSGRPAGDGKLRIAQPSALRLRLPIEQIGVVLPLAGQTLDVAGARLVVGAPTVHAIVPAASLDARLVIVKLTGVPTRDHPTLGRRSLDRTAIEERVKQELARQLEALGIHASAQLCGHGRMSVAGRSIMGFSVRVQGLDADASLALQTKGLGGKRKMGCGIFRPTRGM
jgi:CRISPR-associated endonuclease/helicase Cas3